jgi:hypothetical protein
VHDTLNLEERGIPSVFVATVEFTDAAVRQAESLGGQANGIYVEHPIQDRTDEEMKVIADRALDAVLAGLLS